MNIKLHHVALTVSDIDKATEWYSDKLGFKVDSEYDSGKMQIKMLSLTNFTLELFCFRDKTKSLPKYRKQLFKDLHVIGTKHFCLEVDDLDKFVKILEGKGVKFIKPIDTTASGGRYIFFKDVDGILIEAYQS